MKRWILVLALGMTLPVAAGDKPDKGKKGAKSTEVPLETVLADADQKATAGDLEGAIAVLKPAAERDATGEASLHLGRVLETKADVDLAMDAYTAASGKLSGPKKGEALGRLSSIQDLRGDPAAGATAEAAIATDPGGVWPTIALARARARQGKGDEAAELAQKAVAAGGGAVASTAVGAAQEARGDLVAAEKAYRSALGAPEARTSARVGLARVLRKTGRPAEAEPLLMQVLAETPGAVEAYKESARVRMALNRLNEAMSDAATAAAMAESDPDAQRLVKEVSVAQALSNLAEGQFDLAIQTLTALRDKAPDDATPRVGLAKALTAKKQFDPAIAELKKAIELDPSSADAHYQLGYIQHVFKANPAAALPEYQQAVTLEPANVAYRTNLGAALLAMKDFDHSVAELTKVTETPGYDRADAWIYLGQAHLGAKRYKDAVAALEKALAVAPKSDQANAFLAWCYFGLKDGANFKKYGEQAKGLGYKEPTLLQYLTRVEAGEPIK